MKDPNNESKPVKPLKCFPDYQFDQKVLTRAPEYARKRTVLEVLLIESLNSSLNEQFDPELSVIFRNGAT